MPLSTSKKIVLGMLGGAFSPPDIPGLKLWLKADGTLWQDVARTTPAVADGDVIGAWDDASGLGNHATQATTANKPLLKLAIQNGRAVVRFDGVNDFLSVSMAVASGSKTFLFALNPVSTTESNRWLFDTATGRLLLAQHANSLGRIGWYDDFWRDIAPATTGWQLLTFHMTSGGNGEIFRNGGSLGTAVYTVKAIGGSTNIGSSEGGTQNTEFDAGEFLIYDTALSTANRQAVETYLNSRWAIY